MSLKDDNTMVHIGRFGGAVGLKGEIKANLYAEDSENLHEGTTLYVESKGKIKSMEVNSVRYQKNRPVIRLDGIEDRNSVEALTNLDIYISEDDLEELEEGEYYIRDLIGCEVYDIVSDRRIGVVDDIIDNTVQNIYQIVDDEGKVVLIPAVEAFEREIDIENRIIKVELIPGFLEV